MLTEEGKMIRDIKERIRIFYSSGTWDYGEVMHKPGAMLNAVADINSLLKNRERICRKANDALSEKLMFEAAFHQVVLIAKRQEFDHRTDPNL